MPCDYSTYHPDFRKKIRPDILERDGHKCKFCGIENYAVGWRLKDGSFEYAEDYLKAKKNGAGFYTTSGRLRIILTVAHLDGNKDNNDYDNLAALCQRCHLSIDKEQHMKNARLTRERKRGLQSLF